METTKRCTKCGETKPASEFYKSSRTPDRLDYRCRPCKVVERKARYARDPAGALAKTREWQAKNPERYRARLHQTRMRDYGLTPESYLALLESQGGGCAICGAEPTPDEPRFPVDHDHSCCPGDRRSCGRCVRGILCPLCNRLLGRFERHRERFIDYTEKKEA